MMGKVGEFGDANNRNKPSPAWLLLGTYSLSWDAFAAPKWLNSLGSLKLLFTACLRLFFPVDCSITKSSQHVSTISTAKKNNEINTSHHIMAAHPKAGMQIWCTGVGPMIPPMEQRFQASGCISNYPFKED